MTTGARPENYGKATETDDKHDDLGFQPKLTPMEMLELGVFGGWYSEGDIAEYPAEWFENAKLSTNGFDMTLNCFNIASGLNRSE